MFKDTWTYRSDKDHWCARTLIELNPEHMWKLFCPSLIFLTQREMYSLWIYLSHTDYILWFRKTGKRFWRWKAWSLKQVKEWDKDTVKKKTSKREKKKAENERQRSDEKKMKRRRKQGVRSGVKWRIRKERGKGRRSKARGEGKQELL